MPGIALALGAALGWGIADFLGGRASRAAPALVILGLSQALGLVLAAAAAVIFGLPAPSAGDLLWAVGSGLALTVGLGALYQAMAVGAMAIASPVAATGNVIPVAVGLAGGDRPSVVQWAGVVAAMAGVILCSRERSLRVGAAPLAAGFGLAVIAAIGGGLTSTALAAASSAGVLWVLLIQRATVAALALAVARTAHVPLRLRSTAMPAVVAIGVADVAGTGLFTLAATRADLSLVAVVASVYPVVTAGLAYALLAERVAPHQAIGALIALAGTAAIAGG